jgi:hypothetical protein
MKRAAIIVLLLLGAWTYEPARARTYEPVFGFLGPQALRLVEPSQEGAARTKARHLLRMLIADLRQGRPLPDRNDFDQWVRSRTNEDEPTRDPWGSLYYFDRRRDGTVVVGSPGPDRTRGTADDIIVTGKP